MNIFTEKILTNKQEEIKDFILQNFEATLNPKQYAFWEIKNKDFVATFYNSGKFVVQGKSISALIEKLNEIGILDAKMQGCKDAKKNENPSPFTAHHLPYIGTDESGKGDFFGPLIIAGVMIDETNKKLFESLGIKDSKKMKDKDIMVLAHEIQKHSICSIVPISNIRYNELYISFKNLNKLLAWGHARAIENILEKVDSENKKKAENALLAGVPFDASKQVIECKYALSDKFGDESLILNALMQKGKTINLEQRVRAESDTAVAAASVLARANFLQRMADLESYYGCKFPKGCNEAVKEAARVFAKQFGVKRLSEVCKAHFKTLHEL